MSGRIKGGGLAIMSRESQRALIDLLIALDDKPTAGEGSPPSPPSVHDEERTRKKFARLLVRRFEARHRRSGEEDATARRGRSHHHHHHPPTHSSSRSSTSEDVRPNVRVELVEAVFRDDGRGKKKRGGGGDGAGAGAGDDVAPFAVGVRRAMVLPRTTTVPELLKRSKARLRMRRNPTRAFVIREAEGGGGHGREFDIDRDLTAIEDGTVVYVSATRRVRSDDDGEDDDDDDDDETTPARQNGGDDDEKMPIVDPLDSVKRVYQLKEEAKDGRRHPRGQPVERVDEIVDADRRRSLGAVRSGLPISSHRERILRAVRDNGVVVLTGSTGSGKSTQVPQFLLEEEEEEDTIDGGDRRRGDSRSERRRRRPYIVVTEPRKVAAVSLAHRVAEERGCPPPGVVGSSVGYMVRNDTRVCFRSCRIIYMTIGVLLRILVANRGMVKDIDDSSSDDDEGGKDGHGERSGKVIVPPLSIDTISHLIIDETHERDVNTDFSLTLLRGLLSSSSSCPKSIVPRLILMSATASSKLFLSYFSTNGINPPVAISVPGTTFPVECRWLSHCEKYTKQKMMRRHGGKEGNDRGKSNVQGCNDGDERKAISSGGDGKVIELSPRAVEKIDNIFIRSLIVKIINEQLSDRSFAHDANNSACDRGQMTGAILVFLPGSGEIESLARCLYEKSTIVGDRSLCTIMKLHSTISKSEQRRVFRPVSVGTVKIVLATNIAETSVTIPDISHVIDSCRVKESRYNPSTRIKELVTVWSSYASLTQRAGRAGRTNSGVCWRLCSEEFATNNLLPQTAPEMARTPLDELILQIGLLFEHRRDEFESRVAKSNCHEENRLQYAPGFKPHKFLSMTPTPPSERALSQACKHLLEVEALKIVDCGDVAGEQSGLLRLTPLGYHLSRLPMDAKVGKLLIIGCLLGCLDNALTIAAALSCSKSCFSPVFGGQNKSFDSSYAEERDSLIQNGFGGKDWAGGTVKGDLIAVIAAYRAWVGEEQHHRETFCRGRALVSSSLREMEMLRKQFFDLMVDAGFISGSKENSGSLDADDCNIAREDALLTSCCIVSGLYPNVCTLIRPTWPNDDGRFLTNDSEATCRPSSSSFQRTRVQCASKSGKDAYAVYHSKHRSLGTEQNRPMTFLSEVNFVSKFALLLFGGELELVNNAIIVDKWLKFKVSSDEEGGKLNAILVLSLRELLDKMILEHVVEKVSCPVKKATMGECRKRIIGVVRSILADES